MSRTGPSRRCFLTWICYACLLGCGWGVRADYAPDGVMSLWVDPSENPEGIRALTEGWTRTEDGKRVRWRRVLPRNRFNDPVLVLANVGVDRVEVSLGGDSLYSFGDAGKGAFRLRAANAVHWIPLPAGVPGRELDIRLISAGSSGAEAGVPMTLYGSSTRLIRHLHRVAAGRTALALLFLMVGVYAGLAWAVRRRFGVRFSWWFAVLTFTLGTALLISSVMEFLPPADAAGIYYPGLLLMLLFPVALWKFMEASLGPGRWKLIRRCWQLQVLVCLALWVPDVLGVRPFSTGAQILGNGVLALQLLVGLVEGGRFAVAGPARNRWIARGIFLFSLAGLIDIGAALVWGNPGFELYPLGAFALVALLAYDQERTAGQAQRQLRRQAEALHRHQTHLEEQVEARTVQLKEATRAAEAASRAKSEFLSNMSHELRTPLNAILGHAQRLRAEGGAVQRERGEVIRRSGEHLLTLINDVLDLAKIEAGRLEVEWGGVELPPLLTGVVEMLRPRAEEKGLRFTFEALTPLPARIRGDERRLRQILLNLLGNAVKFTESGEIRMEVSRAEADLRIEVKDTGPGFGPEDIGRLFQPFEQQEGEQAREGTGLGLGISRALARKLGGELEVDSLPGVGSTFCLRLPCRELDGGSVDVPDRPAGATSSVRIPEAYEAEYRELRNAVRIGDLDTVRREIDRLRLRCPGHGALHAELARHAAEFNLEALQNLCGNEPSHQNRAP